MSTELKTEMKEHQACLFWGGVDKGMMAQITRLTDGKHLTFTLVEATELVNTLAGFITDECKRRQSCLKQQIADFKEMEKTVFEEIATLPDELFSIQTISVQMVDKFCPTRYESPVREKGE